MGLYVNAWGIVRWRRPGKKGFVALSGLGTMLAATLLRITLSAPQPERRLRIGFQNSPPYHFPDAEGRPSGPAVDLIRVAAQAEKIELEWTFAPQGPEEALRSGAVDLWPLMADLPERHRFQYISAPWARLSYALIIPAAQPTPGPTDLVGKTLAVMARIDSDSRTARKFFPGVRLLG